MTFFDNDVFGVLRLALNDVQDTQALIGGIVDLNDQSTTMFIEMERRLGRTWKLEFESRLFINVADDNPMAIFKQDDFITLRLSRFF